MFPNLDEGVGGSPDSQRTKGIKGKPLMKRRGSAPALFISPPLTEADVLYQEDLSNWEKMTPEMLGLRPKDM